MTTALSLPADTLAALVEAVTSGDAYDRARSFPLPDGGSVSIRQEPDADHSLTDDGDWYGSLQWPDRGSRSRPAQYNGAARKLTTRDGPIWWQPPAEMLSNPDALARLESRIRGYFLEHWSYVGLVLTVTRPGACPSCGSACGHPVTSQDSIWGIESDCDPEHLSELVSDLFSQCDW